MSETDDTMPSELPAKSDVVPTSQTPPDESDKPSPIEGAIENFLSSIEGIREIAPFLEIITHAIARKRLTDFESERDTFGTIISEKDGLQEIVFPENKASQALRTLRKLKNVEAAQKALPNMFLLALVSQYDAYISDLLKSLFQMRPELIFTSDKQMKFSDISKAASLEEVKVSIIAKEVETIVRQSHSKQFDQLEKLFGVPLRDGLDIWANFIEITERRNLFAHANGVVSAQYTEACRKNGMPENEIPSIGENLLFPSGYFENAYKVLFEISLKLGHVLWRKVLPNDLRSSDLHYNGRCFELIKSGQYELAIKMLDFMCDVVKTHSGQDLQLYMQINRCNAHRLRGESARCEELLDEIDTSALGMEFRLAEAILRQQYAQAAALMKAIGSEHGIITRFAYADWPIFEEFRDSKYFLKAYEDIFGEQFTITAEDGSVAAAED